MKRIVVVLGVAAVMASMVAMSAGTALSQTSPSETLDANTLPRISDSTNFRGFVAESNPARAQTFTAENSGALTSAQIQAYKVCEAASDIRVQIATVDSDGVPTNNILAETTIPASAFPTEDFFTGLGDLVQVEFSNPALVESGEKYAFIFRLESPSAGCPEAPFSAPYALPLKGDVYPEGVMALEFEGSWFTQPDAPHDHVFAIYVTPFDDTTPPEVSSTYPLNNATGVPATANISATFFEEGSGIDPSTLTNSTFKVVQVKPTGNVQVQGDVSYDAGSQTATFDPSSSLAKGLYRAILTGVADNAGNVVPDYTWTFTTVGPRKK